MAKDRKPRRSKAEIEQLRNAPLTDAQQKLVADHYDDALAIAAAWKSDVLQEDEKETIAVEMLIWAAKNFDPNFQYKEYDHKLVRKEGRTPFNTFLFNVVRRRLMMSGRSFIEDGEKKFKVQKNRIALDMLLYQSTIDAKYEESGRSDRFEDTFAAPQETDHLEYVELLNLIKKELTEKQRAVLEAFEEAQTVSREANGTNPEKITLAAIAKKFGVSRERIRQHVVEIQRVANEVKERMEAEGNG